MKKILFVTFLLMSALGANNITLTGTVISDGQKMIGSRYMGYVKKVYVKLGDRVKREDVMLEQAQIALEYWKDRLHVLNKKKENAKKKFGMTGFDWDDLEGQVENVKAMMESTKIMVKK